MKPIVCLFVLALSLSAISIEASAQSQKKKKKVSSPAKVTVPKTSVRGAASVQELGNFVFSAIQTNNFESITQYFPTETDVNVTSHKTSDEDLQLVLEEETPASIQNSFQTDFQDLQNKAIEQSVNLSELSLMEVQPAAQQKANRILPVNLLLTNPNNQTLSLTFETLKLNGRFFLFQHLGFTANQK